MGAINLPPGCRISDLPGNRDEDVAWQEFLEEIQVDSEKKHLDAHHARLIWKVGLSTWKVIQKELLEEFQEGVLQGETSYQERLQEKASEVVKRVLPR